MNRTLVVAWREFTHTVMTKGFIIGVAIVPVIMLVGLLVAPLLISDKPPKVSGTVTIVDPTGAVAPGIVRRLAPETLAERYAKQVNALQQAAADAAPTAPPAAAAVAAAIAAGALPDLKTEVLPADTNLDTLKNDMRTGTALDGGRLALVVIDPDAVKPADPAKPRGSYTIFVKPKLDVRIDREIIRDAVVEELKDQRIAAAGQDPKHIRDLMGVPWKDSETVLAAGGTRAGAGKAQFLLPMGFLMLLWIAAMTGGQYLLTSTIEEKSNRIMEVLLSAISPMQLMLGKILGQMGVGLLILGVYTMLGAGALSTFKMLDLLDWQNVALLVVYFLIAFFLIASLMAAVGSAVSEIHEAQSLIGPIMMILILPMIFSPAIIANPNGTLATILSFIPPVSPIVMVLRVPAAETIPTWQIGASIAVGLFSVVVAAWAAAKIFRIGVLMYGKPPNFSTLIRWMRMADTVGTVAAPGAR